MLCKKIKSDENLKNIPVILLTALSDPQDVLKGLECGADDFITKPYDEEYLLAKIRYTLINAGDDPGNPKFRQGRKSYLMERNTGLPPAGSRSSIFCFRLTKWRSPKTMS